MRTNFVEYVDTRHVHTVSFDGVNELVCCGVASERDVGARHSVLFADRFNSVLVQMCQPARSADVDTPLFLFLESNLCGLLI